jgi:hypothetical protein
MKKITVLYLLEIIVFLLPFFIFKTNLLSHIAIGFIFVLPVNVLGILFLKDEIKQIKIYKILHYLILIASLFFYL